MAFSEENGINHAQTQSRTVSGQNHPVRLSFPPPEQCFLQQFNEELFHLKCFCSRATSKSGGGGRGGGGQGKRKNFALSQ